MSPFPDLKRSSQNGLQKKIYTPETNIAPDNRPSQKENIVSQPPLFRGYVSLTEAPIYLVLNHTASSTIRKISNWVGIDGGQAAEGGDLRQLLVKQRQEHFDDPEVAMLEMIMFVILQILTSGSKFSKIWNLWKCFCKLTIDEYYQHNSPVIFSKHLMMKL